MAVHAGRFTAHVDGDFVVFLIGMRFNKPWKVWKWLPVAMAMPKMLRVLGEHLEPWRRFNRRVRGSGDVGVWHETYKVRAGEFEAVYANMPAFGLAAATRHVPVATVGQSAAARLGVPDPSEPAVEPY